MSDVKQGGITETEPDIESVDCTETKPDITSVDIVQAEGVEEPATT